jgi:predicted DCC family thiol-disulfide oxidoreductase YuxK
MKIVYYDGDCGFCRGSARLFNRLKITTLPFQSASPIIRPRLEEAGIHNEIAVFDDDDGKILLGFEALRGLIQDRSPRVATFLGLRPWHTLGTFAYRVVSYNRRIISPPLGIHCACEPDPVPLYQLWFFIIFSALFVGLSGLTTLVLLPAGAFWMGALTSAAILFGCMLATVQLTKETRNNLLRHCAYSLASAALTLLPILCVAPFLLPGARLIVVPLSFAVASAVAALNLRRRVIYEDLSSMWMVGIMAVVIAAEVWLLVGAVA